jgi:aldehyde:ferredoxin oxidoreductase
MGSKNLKAVAVRGTGSVRVAQPDRFMKAVDKSTDLFAFSEKAKALTKYGSLRAWDAKQAACGLPYKNFQELIVPEEMLKKLNPEQYMEKFMVGNRSTLNCPVACDRYLIVNEGPHAGLECSNIQFIALGEFAARLAVEDITSIFKINVLCNQLGVDIDLAAGVIGWAMECYQRGILTDKDTDGLKLEWGDADIIIDLIEKIAHRQGIGDLLAEGCSHAARNFGKGSDYYAMHMKGQDLYEITRGSVGWGLAASVATRGGGHTTGALPCDTESGGGSDFDKINRVIGIETADKPLAYEGKAREVEYMEQFSRVCSSLGFCLYTTFWYDALLTGLGDMAELYSAATGYETTAEELKQKAERILNVEKAFNLIHTSFDRKDDYPPQREFDEPIPSGSKKGWKLEREKWDALLDEYYGLHRWEKETSYPTRSCLQDLDLEVIADDLEKIGKLGKEE